MNSLRLTDECHERAARRRANQLRWAAYNCWIGFYQWRRSKFQGEPYEYWRNDFEESARQGVAEFGLDDFLQSIRGQELPLGNNAVNAVRRLILTGNAEAA